MKHSENSDFDSMMKSIDGIQPVPAPDLFYARLRSRMEREAGASGSSFFLGLQPAVLMSGLLILLVFNVLLIKNIRNTHEQPFVQQENQAARHLGNEMSSVYYFNYE